jgi:uncharacterized membrane protein YdjX (TVP38/TMEM64 family)
MPYVNASENELPPGAPQPRLHWGWKAAAVAAAAGTLFVGLRMVPLGDYVREIGEALDWVRSQGPWGPACFAAAFVVTTVLMVSSSFMMAMAGLLWGMKWGFLPVTAGCTLGATASFLLGRTVLRGWAQRRVAGHPLLAAIDKVVAEKGFRIVLLTRLTPAPSVLMNYAYGLTKVRLGPYVLGTLLGMIPRTLTYLYVGSTLHSAEEIIAGEHRRGPLFWVHLGVGAVVTVAVVFLVGRMAHKALKETLASGK